MYCNYSHLNLYFYLTQYSQRHFTTMTTTVANSTFTAAYRNYIIDKRILRWMKPLLGFFQASIFHCIDTTNKIREISIYSCNLVTAQLSCGWRMRRNETKNSTIGLVVSQHYKHKGMNVEKNFELLTAITLVVDNCYRSISAFDSKIFALWISEYETRVLPLISEKMYRAF